MLNVRIRQRFLRGGLVVGTVGAPVNLTYDAQNLGLTPASLRDIVKGKHPFCEVRFCPYSLGKGGDAVSGLRKLTGRKRCAGVCHRAVESSIILPP